MSRFLFCVLVFCALLDIKAQTSNGIILDSETLQPIAFAEIYFVDLKTGVISNEQGTFTIEHFNQDKIHLQITSLGYQTINEVVDLTSDVKLEFRMDPGHYELEEVVISVPYGKLQGENIINIAHKSLTDLLSYSPITLSEAISNIPGVEQNTTGSGVGKPVIRGLSGNRIVTYAQGIRVENQQWGAEHSLGVSALGLENVEIIKGPASLLYGSDALGGVLYFIEERFARHNTIEGFAEYGFNSNTLGNQLNSGLKIHKENLKFNLFGSHTSNTDYTVPGLNRVFNTRFNETSLKAAFGFNSKDWISDFRYSYLENNYGIVEEDQYTDQSDREFILPYQSVGNHSFSTENTFFLQDSKLSMILGYSRNNRKEFEDDLTQEALGLRLNTFTYNLKWTSPEYSSNTSFILGSQGMIQDNENKAEEILIPDARTKDIGLFGMIQSKIKNINFQAGVRFDRRNIDTEEMTTDESYFPALNKNFSGVTFSAGGGYSRGPSTLKLNISSGYRAPTTTELLSDGVHEGTNRYERGNSSLNSEKAIQFDLSYNYKKEHIDLFLNPFYNYISDYIFITPADVLIDNNPVYDYIQSDAKLYGGEFGFHIHPHSVHWLHLEQNWSTVFAKDSFSDPLPLIPQTKVNSIIKAEIKQLNTFGIRNIFVQHIYKFDQDRTSLFELPTDNYHLVNLGMTAALDNANPIEFGLGVNNIFNTTYTDHLSRFKDLNISNAGINFSLSVRVNFSGSIGDEQ